MNIYMSLHVGSTKIVCWSIYGIYFTEYFAAAAWLFINSNSVINFQFFIGLMMEDWQYLLYKNAYYFYCFYVFLHT